jgi:hypothetical protein
MHREAVGCTGRPNDAEPFTHLARPHHVVGRSVGGGYIVAMALHRGSANGWFDTPCNPVVGLMIFIAGMLTFLACALYVASWMFT